MNRRPHIIAASPSGDQLTSARSTALADRAKSADHFAETRRAILARLNGKPVHVTVGEPTWRDELADDWRDFIREVHASPYSHALVAVAAFIAGLLLIVVPAMIGAGAWS
jgi:hypothetical protein